MSEIDFLELQNDCGLLVKSDVVVTILGGEDRCRYLNGLVTCQVQGLEPGSGVYGFFTDNKGHILSDVVIRAQEDRFWLELPIDSSVTIAEQLNRYIVADRVDVEADLDVVGLSIVGGDCEAAVRELVGPIEELGSSWSHVEVELFGEPTHLCRDERMGAPSRTFWVPRASSQQIFDRLLESLPPDSGLVSDAAVDVARVAAGMALFGTDFGPENLPQESGIDGAVSFEKGCYLGQEVVARLHYRGQASRAIRSIRFESAEPLPKGSKLLLDGRQAGVVTSFAHIPGSQNALGLAMLQRRAFDTGTKLEDEQGRVVEVVEV